MAIGTAAAIGLGLAGVGSFLGSKSQSKAAGKAAQTSQNVANQNNALARDIYGQNRVALSPYMQAGIPATNTLNAMLGLGQPQPQVQSLYSGPNPTARPPAWKVGENFMGDYMTPTTNPGGNPQAGTAPNPMDAFRQYISNSDYGFQFGEGANRVNSGYAGSGTLQSGAAMKALEDYRQNLQSGYRGEFMNALANQQGVGLAGASALAGVGQNYVNTISQNNNSAGTAAANAALVKGANNPFSNTLSLLGGGLFGMAR